MVVLGHRKSRCECRLDKPSIFCAVHGRQRDSLQRIDLENLRAEVVLHKWALVEPVEGAVRLISGRLGRVHTF